MESKSVKLLGILRRPVLTRAGAEVNGDPLQVALTGYPFNAAGCGTDSP
jgi:hypothetical protein